jgi:hypothetical protein
MADRRRGSGPESRGGGTGRVHNICLIPNEATEKDGWRLASSGSGKQTTPSDRVSRVMRQTRDWW